MWACMRGELCGRVRGVSYVNVYFGLAVTVYRGTYSEMVPYVLCGVSSQGGWRCPL